MRRHGLIILSVLALAVLGACSPPPELQRPPASPEASAQSLLPPGRVAPLNPPGTTDGAEATADGGGRMAALRFAKAADAARGYEDLAKRLESRPGLASRSRTSAGDLQFTRYAGPSVAGLLWLSDRWVFAAEAADAERLAALIAASKAGGAVGGGNVGLIWALAGAGVAAFGIVMALVIRQILRSQIVAPAAGVVAVGRDEMLARLMALNDPSRPWQVRLGPEADVVVEWKYADVAWWGVMARQGVREIQRLRLYLDEAQHRVGALDESSSVEWAAGALGAPSLSFTRTGFRGVQLVKRQRTQAYGFDTPAGGGFGKKLDVDFDLDAMKQPVIATVAAAGWTYAPVMRPQRA